MKFKSCAVHFTVEFNLPIMSATQTTRSGFSNTDIGLEDTSESFGLPATADLMFALISTEELDNHSATFLKELKENNNDLKNFIMFSLVSIFKIKNKIH